MNPVFVDLEYSCGDLMFDDDTRNSANSGTGTVLAPRRLFRNMIENIIISYMILYLISKHCMDPVWRLDIRIYQSNGITKLEKEG